MQLATLDGQAEEWVRVVVTRDADTADRWRDALEAVDIGAEVHLEDVLRALPGTSTLPGALPDLRPFAFGVYVPGSARAHALEVLIDAGWNGRAGRTGGSATIDARTVVAGAALALTAGLAVVIARLVIG